jgi:hypothetical protein
MKTKLPLLFILVFAVAVSLNAQTDPGTDDITSEWTFDDGTANDPIGFISGQLFGTTTIEDGDLVIDAADEYVILAAGLLSISSYTELSVSTWFSTWETPDINTGFHMIWYFGGSQPASGGTADLGSNGIFLSPARGDDVCRTAISCGNTEQPWTAESGVNYTPEVAFGGEMWHMVTTINDTYIALYVNGVLVDTTGLASHNSLGLLSDEFAWIGRGGYSDDPNYWCRVHKLTLFDRMLSDDEVLWLYQNPTSVNEIKSRTGITVYESNGMIYMLNPENAVINSLQVYDVTGRMVLNTNDFTGVIRHNLPHSVYIVKLQSNKGDFVSKIIVD